MNGPELRRPLDDADDRVSGRYRFAVDRRVPGALAGRVVRSIVPHGRLGEIDTADALDVPGVVAVVTGADLAAIEGLHPYYGEIYQDQPVLAVDRVRYVGEPVAVVLAEDERAADAGAEQVFVDYEELPYVVDPVAAGEPGAAQVHDEHDRNTCAHWSLRHGDIEEGWRQSDRIYEHEYWSPTANHVPMEPHVATAAWDGHHLQVWSGTQAPYTVRARLAQIFGMPEDHIRVSADNLGGGFGAKTDAKIEPLVACASLVTGRPVRIELRRDEVFVTAAKHSARVRIRTGVKNDGTLVARQIEIVWNAGAYAIATPRSARTGMIRSPGPYRIPHVSASSIARYTHTVPTGPFRGAMTGQICWAHESALDEIAADLGIDPVEMRRRNVLRDGDEYATGEAMQEMFYTDLVEAVAKGIEWDTPVEPSGEPHRVRGKGMALVLKSTRTPSRSEVGLRLDRDGRFTILISAVEMGQGAQPTMALIAAGELDVDPGLFDVSSPDTQWTPFDSTTSSSRTTFFTGSAVRDAARNLKDRIVIMAADVLAVDPDSIQHDRGAVVVRQNPQRRRTYEQILADAGEDEVVVAGAYETPPGLGQLDADAQGMATISWHQGCVGVEVEVDVETGHVEVLRAHGANYAGRAVDAERVRKQSEGGMIFGLGQAVMEEMIFDEGQLTNPNLSDYMIPSILDAPGLIASTIVERDAVDAAPHGVGENTVPPMAPAVGNAIFRATGARIRSLPLTAERVLQALDGLPDPVVRPPVEPIRGDRHNGQ